MKYTARPDKRFCLLLGGGTLFSNGLMSSKRWLTEWVRVAQNEPPRPGIEPGMPGSEPRVLTTTLSRPLMTLIVVAPFLQACVLVFGVYERSFLRREMQHEK